MPKKVRRYFFNIGSCKNFAERVAFFDEETKDNVVREKQRKARDLKEIRQKWQEWLQKSKDEKDWETAEHFLRSTRYDKSVNPKDIGWTIEVYRRCRGTRRAHMLAGLQDHLMDVLKGWAHDMRIYPIHLRFMPPCVNSRVRLLLFLHMYFPLPNDDDTVWPIWLYDQYMWECPTPADFFTTLYEEAYESYYASKMEHKHKQEIKAKAEQRKQFFADMANRWAGDKICIYCNFVHRRCSNWITIFDHLNHSTNVSTNTYNYLQKVYLQLQVKLTYTHFHRSAVAAGLSR